MKVASVGSDASYTVGALRLRVLLRPERTGVLEVARFFFFAGVFFEADFFGVLFFLAETAFFGVFDRDRFGAAAFFFSGTAFFLAGAPFSAKLAAGAAGALFAVAAVWPRKISGNAINSGNHTFISTTAPSRSSNITMPCGEYPSPCREAATIAPARTAKPAAFITFRYPIFARDFQTEPLTFCATHILRIDKNKDKNDIWWGNVNQKINDECQKTLR